MNKIGIIGAMEEEVVTLKTKMQIKGTTTKACMEFVEGTLENKEVVVVRCGVGKVNAAICTQILIENFNIDCVINVGIAGGLYPDINIGDIVISSDTVQHDMETDAVGGARGEIPRLGKAFFEADKMLIDIAQEAAEKIIAPYKVYIGRIASGDQFVANIAVKEDIYTTFTAYCAEMEGAAIAHTCFLNEIPFVVIRSISDKADNSAGGTFEEFVELSSKNAMKVIVAMLQKL